MTVNQSCVDANPASSHSALLTFKSEISMTDKKKSENREKVCEHIAHIKKTRDESFMMSRHLDLFYTIIKTHPHYSISDSEVKSLDHFLRDQVDKELYWLNEEIAEYGEKILTYVRE